MNFFFCEWGVVVWWAYSSCISLTAGRRFESRRRLSLLKNVSFGEKRMKKKEEEEDLERVKPEDRGRRRRQSNQERIRERLSVRFKDD